MRRVAFFVVTEPGSLFYTLAITFLIGSLLAYVSLMPQIFSDVFGKPQIMTGVFAACAATMGVGSMLNASLVERLGLKRISHSALTAFIVMSGIHLAWCLGGRETIPSFMILQALTMGLMSLATSNFSAIAMEKVGHVAGTAASLQGVVTTVGAAIISAGIGAGWKGGIYLLPLGALVCGLISVGLGGCGGKRPALPQLTIRRHLSARRDGPRPAFRRPIRPSTDPACACGRAPCRRQH
ncbi:MAG: hypothetical protein WDN06_22175 [Asticcacaulis sp.]